MRAKSHRRAVHHDLKYSTARVSGAIGVVDDLLHALLDLRVDAIEQHIVLSGQFLEFLPLNRAFQSRISNGHDMTQHSDAEFGQKQLCESAHGHSGGGLASAGSFEDVASLRVAILQAVGMPRAWPVHGTGMVF